MKIVCVGGHNDGSRIETGEPPRSYIRLLIPQHESKLYDDFRIEEYKIMWWYSGHDSQIPVYVPIGQSEKQTMELLISGYRIGKHETDHE